MSEQLSVSGKLLVKYDTQKVSDKFKKVETINGKDYTNFAKFQLTQAKCDIIDRFKEGDTVKVSFNIKGNRWERDGKVNYMTNLDAWAIHPAAGATQPQQAPPTHSQPSYNPPPAEESDLPF